MCDLSQACSDESSPPDEASDEDKQIDEALFAMFELKFLYSIFIMMNVFQVCNSFFKIFKINNGEGRFGGLMYYWAMYLSQLAFELFLITHFPEVFFFQIKVICYILGWVFTILLILFFISCFACKETLGEFVEYDLPMLAESCLKKAKEKVENPDGNEN